MGAAARRPRALSLDGTEYEAFNTSGGLGTLCETLSGKVETLDYKSVRYPGHRDLVQFLLEDLRLSTDRDTLKSIMRRAVPSTKQDVVLVFITVTGVKDGQLVQDVFTRKIFAKDVCGMHMSAIRSRRPARCARCWICSAKEAAAERFHPAGKVSLKAFLSNRFGRSCTKAARWSACTK